MVKRHLHSINRFASHASPSIDPAKHCSINSNPLPPKPTLLLIAAKELRLYLETLLSSQNYNVHSTCDCAMACTMLGTKAIDLVILHFQPDNTYGGWETYEQLRQVTTNPVLAFANFTAADFSHQPQLDRRRLVAKQTPDNGKFTTYLRTVAMLMPTSIGSTMAPPSI